MGRCQWPSNLVAKRSIDLLVFVSGCLHALCRQYVVTAACICSILSFDLLSFSSTFLPKFAIAYPWK